jgi:glycosyltransferase involved in cell wall biosynthesis
MTNAMLNDAAMTPVAIPFVPALGPTAATDVVTRVEETLEEIDSLWDYVEIDDVPTDSGLPADLLVSVVIPVYNEKKTVLDVIARVKGLPFNKEIIVVDDCSTDGTRGWLETLRGAPGLELICKDKNEGKGAALRDGFEIAKGHVVVVQDADLEYDPRDLEKVIQPIAAGDADVVYGSRYLFRTSGDRSFAHRMVNRAITCASNLFTGLRLTDMETCHKAFRTNVIRELPLKQRRFGFEPEVTAKVARRDYRVLERPVRYLPRSYAQGKKIGILDALNAMFCVVRYGLAD